jgi:L-ascorbate metabolism protein UlaG (beta-lactamase superfamily)
MLRDVSELDFNEKFRLLLVLLAFAPWAQIAFCAQTEKTPGTSTTIEYISHACFRISSPTGKQLLIDPYASRVWLGYDFPSGLEADAILISHPHYDHDGGEALHRQVPWPPRTQVLRAAETFHLGDFSVFGHPGKHADPWGKEFGQSNTIWAIEVAGLRIVHVGDNGPLSAETIGRLGRVDVLMLPIDSKFHILKSNEIDAIRSRLTPKVLIPMHYRQADLELSPDKPDQLGGIDEWAKGQSNVRYLTSNEAQLSPATLPKEPEILIFGHSPLVTRPANVQEGAGPHKSSLLDLLGAVVTFRSREKRWPRDYPELLSLNGQAGGNAQMGKFDRVNFTELPDGSLNVCAEANGQTNRLTLPAQ